MSARRSTAKINRAKQTLEKRLLPFSGFLGTGLTALPSGEPAILVLVNSAECAAVKECAALTEAPRTWEGIPVRTEVVGAPRKLKRG
jgi:hypothetical protein